MKRAHVLVALVLAATLTAGLALASEPALRVGDPIPTVKLLAPFDPDARTYLGLGEEKEFVLGDIKAQVAVVLVMNAFCPYCQKDAPVANQLYQAIISDPKLKDRVKFFGLAANNTYFETELYRDRYEVKYHLVPDPELRVADILGEVRTPRTLVLRLGQGGQGKVVISKEGPLVDAKGFLDQIIQAGGLQ